MTWLRIFAKADHEWEGNWDVMVDAFVDDLGTTRPGVNYFGICGGFDRSDAMPFMLRQNGNVDFGCIVSETSIRDSRMNIHDRIIKIGEYFTHFHGDDEMVLKIVALTDLADA